MRRIVALVTVLTLVSCGPSQGVGGPPPLSVVGDDDKLMEIPATTFCWERQVANAEFRGLCADGIFQPEAYPIEIHEAELDFTLPLAGWSLEGSVSPAGTHEAKSLAIVAVGDTYQTELPGGGVWDVSISGQGPEGDAFYVFRVTVRRP